MIGRTGIQLVIAVAALSAACLLLVSTLRDEPGREGPESSTLPNLPDMPGLGALLSAGPRTSAEVATILARPVFAPNRMPRVEPPSASAEANAGVPSPTDHLRVVGLVVAGADSVALVQSQKTGQTVSVRPGDPLEGWQVLRVSPDGVVLAGQGEERTLVIPRQDGSLPLTSTAESGVP